MEKYQLLKKVIALVEEFESEKNNEVVDLNNFIAWSSTKIIDKSILEQQECKIPNSDVFQINSEISRYIFRLNKFAAFYSKDLLQNLPLISLNDFGFVANVHKANEIAKMDLIRLMLMEKSPGMEIIKRLISKNIFEEFDNDADKRSKKLRLTNYGNEIIIKSYQVMATLANKICADMNEQTKLKTLETLQYLDSYHQKKIWVK